MPNSKFWNFAKNSANEGELYLYGDICSSTWWEDEISPQTFKDDLDALGNISVLHLYINSGGGDVFAGQAIHSMIKRCKAHTIAHIDGLAASIATVVALGADEIIMAKGSLFMIHNAWSVAWGNAEDMRKMAETLDVIGQSIIAVYKEKTGLSEEELKAMMDEEKWMTAQEAVDLHFADSIAERLPYAASISNNILFMNNCGFDIGKFQNRPPVDKLNKEVISSMKLEDILAKLNPEHRSVVEDAMKDAVKDSAEKAEKLEKSLETANDSITQLTEELAMAKKDLEMANKVNSDPVKDALAKADLAVVEAFNAMQAKLDLAEKDRLAVEDKQRTKVVSDKLAEFANLAIPTDQTETFKNLMVSNEATYEIVIGVLAAANKAIEASGAMKATGTANGAEDNTTGALAQLQAKAKQIAAAENMTEAKAFVEACRRDTELYNQYTQELMKEEE